MILISQRDEDLCHNTTLQSVWSTAVFENDVFSVESLCYPGIVIKDEYSALKLFGSVKDYCVCVI